MFFKIAVSDPEKVRFSLDKSGADFSHNQIILNSIVGTLVKYGLSGRLEPYLAESWTVSSDKKIWQFKIRANLKCEDGTPITAGLFKDTLQTSLVDYAKKGSVIMFDHLLGWSDFTSGKSKELPGLSVSGDIVEFKFDKNPDDLLELLRMPYFGIWLENNGKLISSGPYTLKEVAGPKVLLGLRTDWFTSSSKSFRELEISFVGLTEKDKEITNASIIRMPFFVNAETQPKNGYWISSPPTRLESFVLSPSKNNFFNDLENREIFKSRVSALGSDLVKSKYFFPAARTEGLVTKIAPYKKLSKPVKKLTFALERATYSESELENLNKIITAGLDGSGVDFEILPRDLADKEWFTKTDSNNYFDSRVASVDIGAYPVYMVIKMMFCTKLGVNFPDPTGKMCELVHKGINSASAVDQKFVDEFNKILHDEAVIIPILHHSDKWLVAEDLDPSTLPATTLYPQFELIRLR